MELKIVIVDDDPQKVRLLQKVFDGVFGDTDVKILWNIFTKPRDILRPEVNSGTLDSCFIVIDFNLPEFNGVELYEVIESIQTRNHYRQLLFYSAYPTRVEQLIQERGIEARVFDSLEPKLLANYVKNSINPG